MKLVEQGKLSPGDLLHKFVPEVPGDKASITIHHLLTHTSGLINYSGDDYVLSTRDEFLDTVLNAPLAFEPGEQYAYSNAGYSVLAALIEMISGQPYETFLNEHVLKPAGMEMTGYIRPKWSGARIAHWYNGAEDNEHALKKPYPSWNIIGNGEMLSTLDDILLWDRALAEDVILGAVTKAEMYTPFLRDYGYGWRITSTPLGKLIAHNGASDLGSSALFRRYVDVGLTMILFCNQSFGSTPMVVPVGSKLDALLEGEKVQLPPVVIGQLHQDFNELPGVFQLEAGGFIHIEDQGDVFNVRPETQNAINWLVFPDGPVETILQLNQVTLNIFESLMRGDDGPLRSFLDDPDRRFKPVSGMIDRIINDATHTYGDFVAVEVSGTVPSSFQPDALDTGVTLRFEKGSVGLTSITQKGINTGMAAIDTLSEWAVTGIKMDEELVCYHISLARTARLGTTKDQAGKVIGLTAGEVNPKLASKVKR